MGSIGVEGSVAGDDVAGACAFEIPVAAIGNQTSVDGRLVAGWERPYFVGGDEVGLISGAGEHGWRRDEEGEEDVRRT